jgi:AcrR family transcriptional regulator|tara:strand:+ start:2287 stop:3072 length:786 start_codon:yes stop_codon:yes gene_type:complete
MQGLTLRAERGIEIIMENSDIDRENIDRENIDRGNIASGNIASGNIARGNIARQANKKLRRQRILDLAVHLIATDGIEGFTINRLAREAGVSTPTIHNLFGKKNDIIKELVSNLIQHMSGLTVQSPPIDPIENAKFFLGNMITEFEKNTDFFRVALMSTEQLGLFHPNLPNGLFQEAQKVAAPRKEWYESGLLLGNIEPSVIMKRVHNSNRLGRLDWASGYIDLNQMRQQVLQSILLAYASDASPEYHVRLCEEINSLNTP